MFMMPCRLCLHNALKILNQNFLFSMIQARGILAAIINVLTVTMIIIIVTVIIKIGVNVLKNAMTGVVFQVK